MTGILYFDEIDSTNDEAKRRLRAGEDLLGSVIAADRQTAGRGRLGKSFASPGGDSIYASFVLKLPESLAEQKITIFAAVAVCYAIEKTTSYRPAIKGVNDILAEGKKVCGILAESVPGAVVLGIGVNINLREDDLPDELREIAGSLNMDKVTRAHFFEELIGEVFRCMSAAEKAASAEAALLMDEYRARSVDVRESTGS